MRISPLKRKAVDIEPKVGSILYTLLNRKSRELPNLRHNV